MQSKIGSGLPTRAHLLRLLGATVATTVLPACGAAGGAVVIDERFQLNRSNPSRLYTIRTPGKRYRISVEASGPVDWAVLRGRHNLAFPLGPYRYVEPFEALRSERASHTGVLPEGVYYLEVNAQRSPSAVSVNVVVIEF